MEKQNSNLNNGNKVKLLCSYGGKILSRSTDHQLSYVGGDSKILAVDRNVKFSEIIARLNSLCNRDDSSAYSVKYQLPGEDLDSLVTLIDDEDVEHMMVEYDRMQRISTKPARLRLFIFDCSGPPNPPLKSRVKDSVPDTPLNPDYLFGFDKDYQPTVGPPLDFLQIPGMVMPENYGVIQCGGFQGKTEITEGHGISSVNNVNANGGVAAASSAVYGVPTTMVNGGVYGLVPAVVRGNREQAVYNIVPVMPPPLEQRMTVSTGNSLDVKVNQRNF